MALTLHNYTLSGSCYKVRLLLEFLQVDYHTMESRVLHFTFRFMFRQL